MRNPSQSIVESRGEFIMQKCRHMKKIRFMNSVYCICKSPKGGHYKYNQKYENIIRRVNLYVMGSANRTNEYDNWWSLCVNGKAPSGITPPNCIYY